MNTIYKIVAGNSVRYIRATNAASARVRAFKVWGIKAAQTFAIGEQTPDIGAVGYDAACNQMEAATSGASLRAMQKAGGADNTGRSFYKVTEKEKTKVNNKAIAMMQMLGLA